MTFRTKLLLSLTLLVSISCVVAGGILYVQSRHFLFRELQSKVLSIAASGAAAVDGDLHRAIQSPGDEDTPEYRMLEAQLREIRDANRRADVQVAYIYTVLYDPENPRVVRFGVDAEEDPAKKSYVGDIYEGRPGNPMIFAESQVDADFSVDRWGTWLSANAPIRDGSGAVVAALGVDVRAEDIHRNLARIRLSLITAVGISFALAVLLSLALAGRVSRPLLAVRNTVQRIGRGDLEARVYLKTRDEFGQVAAAINEMAKGLREREELKSAFARYVSQQVMEEILETGGELSLKGSRKKVTVLFSDIRNFTTFAEGHTPEEVVGLLNEYFEAMIDVIFRNKGTLDKFMGDGLMVLFGAPLPDSDQELNAVRAAVEMQRELSRLSKEWTRNGESAVKIGIGIHTGQAIVGNIGSSRRMEYTAIGDTVNLASRLESTTKTLGVSILVSESTYQAAREGFPFVERGSVTVKGRHQPVAVYSVDADELSVDSRPRPTPDTAAEQVPPQRD
jgi:adenylate cyclase